MTNPPAPATPARARVRPRRADVRAEILAAAIEMFEAHGYAGTTLDAIATSAGYTKGAVYSNFGGKPQLFGEAAALRLAEEGAPHVAQAGPALLSGIDRAALIDSLVGTLGKVAAHTGPWQIMLSELGLAALRDPSAAAAYSEVMRARTGRLVDMLGNHPALRSLDQQRLTRGIQALLGLLNSLSLERVAAPDLVDERVERLIITAFLGAVLP